MSNKEINTPEVDQEVKEVKKVKKTTTKKTTDKNKDGFNGIYRRNTRVKKKTSSEEQVNTSEEDNNKDSQVQENNPVTVAEKKEPVIVEEKKEPVAEKKRLTTKKRVVAIATPTPENNSVEDNLYETSIPNENQGKNVKTETEKEEPAIVTVRSPFHEVLYLIRQKNAYNHTDFFFELEKVLQNLKFDEIKESNLSLFGFACMYDREIIFQKLCEDYSDFIKQDDLESILKICFTKREETVGNLIKIYSDRFKPSSEFIKELFNSMSISSYRENNNIQILEWLAPYLSEDEYEVFWNKCLEHRNISLMNTALHIPSIKENLHSNFNKYLNGFKLIGREHTFARALNMDYRKIMPQNAYEKKMKPIMKTLTLS